MTIFAQPAVPYSVASFTPAERLVLFGATLAQVEDIHTVAWSFDAEQIDIAAALMARFEAVEDKTPLDRALAGTLAVIVADVDHPDFADEQWDALEQLHRELAAEFGHTPRGALD